MQPRCHCDAGSRINRSRSLTGWPSMWYVRHRRMYTVVGSCMKGLQHSWENHQDLVVFVLIMRGLRTNWWSGRDWCVGAKAWMQTDKTDNTGTQPAPVITIGLKQLSYVDKIRHVTRIKCSAPLRCFHLILPAEVSHRSF